MFKFKPILKTVVWGGDKIAPFKGIETDQEQIGESWELSGVKGHESVIDGGPWDGKTVTELCEARKEWLLGARVYVTEIDPIKATEAVMDGFEVLPMKEAAVIGDFFVTVTGCKDVITTEHMLSMKDGAIVCNAGHFNVEIDVEGLDAIAKEKILRRDSIMGYVLPNGRSVNILAEGRLVNLAAGDGHPAEIMDMSFSIQALCARYLAEHKGQPLPMLNPVPDEIDREVAERKLRFLGVSIDHLTEDQQKYIDSWNL